MFWQQNVQKLNVFQYFLQPKCANGVPEVSRYTFLLKKHGVFYMCKNKGSKTQCFLMVSSTHIQKLNVFACFFMLTCPVDTLIAFV